MQWNIPGTVLQLPRQEADQIETHFAAMFLAGGLSLGQVTGITGLEPYTVQNWVKRGFLSPPVQKRYSLRQLCRIININMLKSVLPMERICGMLGYINGQLDNEADDIIDDSRLYFMFVALAARVKELDRDRDALLDQALENYAEPFPGAGERIKQVLRIMLTAYLAARMQQQADIMLKEIEKGKENTL